MVFTPPGSFVIRSREFGNGSEYDQESDSNIMPDHYVKRLWRTRALPGPEGRTVQFINKDSVDRAILYTVTERGSALLVRNGSVTKGAEEVARVLWESGRNVDKSRMSIGTKSGMFKEMLKKGGSLTPSRIFIGPDGLEYKWKVILEGSNPVFPDSSFRVLYCKDSKHPIATTARFVQRDGEYNDETYPIYIAERGLWMESWIVATTAILEGWDKLS
ncbi:uncharacterized protein BT62DRAFT_995952 [Guyanagaster necrorhizus]|uniref:DUF6593 domain-containing protein n=1 Tax=Guyanagaster necrorhizus TaxID=856835 RepID=A0A9P7VMN1_9AGAR|nr:uncharacterized protein BT62DRAFT_995952 [Guyanagaster necrorhizus MCA 3950]KAG7443348.1 hypothetical protein BT62DRAFT_995952 [Guyanagaster necrorhizus MCA 3950]